MDKKTKTGGGEMTDIIIYTTPEKLLHKQDKLENDEDKSDGGDYYWEFRATPNTLGCGEKVYFATKGFIRGFFIVEEIDIDYNTIGWNAKTWKDIKPIPIKHFQGFKYADMKIIGGNN